MPTLYDKTRLSCEVKSDYSQEQGNCALTSLFIGDSHRFKARFIVVLLLKEQLIFRSHGGKNKVCKTGSRTGEQ